jgi:WD40 repeat protein
VRLGSRSGSKVADVFISYSRRDGAFVRGLVEALEARGKGVWVDTDGIRDAEVFPAALRSAVESSDGFVFVISPDSVASAFCEQEVDHALELNKRIVPLLLEPVNDDRVPEGVRVRNWIPVGPGDFDEGVARLVQALDTDLEWTKEHTSWLLKALEWEARGRERSFLLRGAELADAERWLAGAAGKDPEPTQLHTEYVIASRMAATRRQRAVVATSVTVAVVALALLVFALISRQSAVSANATSKSRALAAESQTQETVDPELAILLAMRAVETKATPEALFALRGALDASPLRARLPAGGPQPCTPPIGAPGLAYDPVGSRFVEGLCDGTIRIFDGATHRLIGRARVSGGTGALAYDRSGSLLAVGTSHGVALLDGRSLATRRVLPAAGAVNAVAFSPDGSRVAATTQDAAQNSALVSWAARGGQARTIANGAYNPVFGDTALRHVVFTSDGRTLIVGGAPGVRVYDARTGRLERTLAGTQVADDIALSPDGRTLAVSILPYNEVQLSITPLPVASTTSNPDTVMLFTVSGWHPVKTVLSVVGVEQPVIAFSPDGVNLAIGGADGKAGLWSIRNQNQVAVFPGAKQAVIAIAFSPRAGDLVTGAADGTGAVWHAGGFEVGSFQPSETITYAGWGPGGLVYTDATGAGFVSWPGLRSLPPLRMLTPGAPPGSEGGQLSRNGTLAWWATPKGVEIWNTRQRRRLRNLPVGQGAPAIALSDDSTRAGYFSPGQPMRIIEIASGRSVTLTGPQPACPGGWRWAVFSPDGHYISATTLCGTVINWNASTGRRISQFTTGVAVSLTDFSSDDMHVAVGGQDGTTTIWNVRTGRLAHVLPGPTESVGVVEYTPDGKLLVVSSFDGNARIWNPASGTLLRILPHSGAVFISPDGRDVATTDLYGVARVWQTCPACGDASALLSIARTRVTRQLTRLESATFGA